MSRDICFWFWFLQLNLSNNICFFHKKDNSKSENTRTKYTDKNTGWSDNKDVLKSRENILQFSPPTHLVVCQLFFQLYSRWCLLSCFVQQSKTQILVFRTILHFERQELENIWLFFTIFALKITKTITKVVVFFCQTINKQIASTLQIIKGTNCPRELSVLNCCPFYACLRLLDVIMKLLTKDSKKMITNRFTATQHLVLKKLMANCQFSNSLSWQEETYHQWANPHTSTRQ